MMYQQTKHSNKMNALLLSFIVLIFCLNTAIYAQIEPVVDSSQKLKTTTKDHKIPIYKTIFTHDLKIEERYLEKLPELWKDITNFSIYSKDLEFFKTGKESFKLIWQSVLSAPNLSSLGLRMANRKDKNPYTFYSYADSSLIETFWKPLSQLKQLDDLTLFDPDTSQAFINYLAQFPNLKELYWSSPYKGLDFSQLTHLKVLTLGSPHASYPNIDQSIKGKLVLPPKLDTLILHNNTLDEILPIIATYKGKLSYLKTASTRGGAVPDLSLLKGKVEVLDWAISTWNFALPPGDSAIKSLILSRICFSDSVYIGKAALTYTNLEALDLGKRITTKLSPSFYQLSNLKHLTIKTNYLSDSIQYLKKLEALTLYSDSLTQLPSTLGKLKNLKKLDLTTTNLTTLPETFHHLTQLEAFKIYSPNLKQLPKELKVLKHLKSLDIFAGKVNKISPKIAQLHQLKELHFHGSSKQFLFPIFRTFPKGIFKNLQQLEKLSFNIRSIVTRAQLNNICRIVPDTTELYVYSMDDKYSVYTPFNLGIYTQYNFNNMMTFGLEFNYYYTPHWSLPKRTNNTRYPREKNYNIFDFHTFNTGIEVNYLKSFIMGYKTSYTYTHKRLNFALQADLIAYTNYKGSFDLRINPKIGIYIPSTFAAFYLMYGYRIPLIPNQELHLVSRHNISLTMRITNEWSIPFFQALVW